MTENPSYTQEQGKRKSRDLLAQASGEFSLPKIFDIAADLARKMINNLLSLLGLGT